MYIGRINKVLAIQKDRLQLDIPRSRTVAIGGHRTGFRLTDFTCHVTFNPTADDFIAAPLSLGYTHQLLIYRRPPPQ